MRSLDWDGKVEKRCGDLLGESTCKTIPVTIAAACDSGCPEALLSVALSGLGRTGG